MKTETMGTVTAGILTLDQPLDLPDQCRVCLAVEPLGSWQLRTRDGLDAWKAFCEKHPVHAGGRQYSREELHERR